MGALGPSRPRPSRPRPLARERSCLQPSLNATRSRHRSVISVQFVSPPALRSLCLVPSPLSPQPQPQFGPRLHALGPLPRLQSIPVVLPERSFRTHPPLLTAQGDPSTRSLPLSLVSVTQFQGGKESLLQTGGVPEASQPLSRQASRELSLLPGTPSHPPPSPWVSGVTQGEGVPGPAGPPAVLVRPSSKHTSSWTVTLCAGVCLLFRLESLATSQWDNHPHLVCLAHFLCQL